MNVSGEMPGSPNQKIIIYDIETFNILKQQLEELHEKHEEKRKEMIQKYKELIKDKGKGLIARQEEGIQTNNDDMKQLQTEYTRIYKSNIVNAIEIMQ